MAAKKKSGKMAELDFSAKAADGSTLTDVQEIVDAGQSLVDVEDDVYSSEDEAEVGLCLCYASGFLVPVISLFARTGPYPPRSACTASHASSFSRSMVVASFIHRLFADVISGD